ncbi:unnamed protein product, partial [Prorocentrum cordatum]
AEARMVGKPFVWLLGAATNLLAAWISRAPPCPTAPSCPASPACPSVSCPNLSCGEVHCRAAEEQLTCPAAPPAPPPSPAAPAAPSAPEPVPAPAEPPSSSFWSWAALLLGHVVLAALQLWRGVIGLVKGLVCRRHAAGSSDPLDLLISSADHDVYEERYSQGNPDIVAVVFSPTRQALQGVDPNLLYRFRREPNGRETVAIQDALVQVADQLYLDRERAAGRPRVLPAGGSYLEFDFTAAAPGPGVPGAGPAALVPAGGAAAGAAPAAPLAIAAAAGAAGPPVVPAPAWVLIGSTGGGNRGDVVQLNGTERIEGDIGLLQLNAGWVAIRRISMDPSVYRCAESGADIRLLGVPPRPDGSRQRLAWREAVPMMVENVIPGWLLDGPRTMLWCAQFIDRKRGGPAEHYNSFVAFYHLTKEDYGVAHYENIMKMMEHLACWDQVNLPDLVGAELAIRQAQLYEYIYSMEFEEPARPREGGRPWASRVQQIYLYMRSVRRRLEKRPHVHGMVDEMTDALNEFWGCPPAARRQAPAGTPAPAAGHALVLSELRQAAVRFGPCPEGLGGPGALEELRISQPYEGDATLVAPVSFDLVDSISLPPAGSRPAALETIDEMAGQNIAHRLKELLLPRQLGMERIREAGPRRLYTDPALRNPRLYATVVRRLMNAGLVDFNSSAVHDAAAAVQKELTASDLPTHPVEASVGGDALGWHFDEDKPVIGLSVRLRWRLRLGIGELLERGWCSGHAMMKVMSHLTSRALIRRELLSCPGAVHGFMGDGGRERRRLTPAVKRELTWRRALLPLRFRDAGRPLSPVVSCVDASWWGAGVTEKTITSDQARRLSIFNERWRFSRDGEQQVAPRDMALARESKQAEHITTSCIRQASSQHDRDPAVIAAAMEQQVPFRVEPKLNREVEVTFEEVPEEVWAEGCTTALTLLLVPRLVISPKPCGPRHRGLPRPVRSPRQQLSDAMAAPLSMSALGCTATPASPAPRSRKRPAAAAAAAAASQSRRRPRAASEAAARPAESDRRAVRRQERASRFPALPPSAPRRGLTFLEGQSVGDATRADYERRHAAFSLWACQRGHSLVTPAEVDKALVLFFHEEFLDGGESSDAWKLMAALAFVRSTCFPWMPSVIQELHRRAPAGHRLFPVTYAQWNYHFKAVVSDLGLQVLGNLTLHQLRHGGASHELYAAARKMPNLRKTRMCEAFIRGRCDQADCKFAHGEGDLTKAELFHKTTMCAWHEKGKCRYGASCRFAHGADELRAKEPQRLAPARLFSAPGSPTPSTESMASEIMDGSDISTAGSLQEEARPTSCLYTAAPAVAPLAPLGLRCSLDLLAAPGLAGRWGPPRAAGGAPAGGARAQAPPSPWGPLGGAARLPAGASQLPMKVRARAWRKGSPPRAPPRAPTP